MVLSRRLTPAALAAALLLAGPGAAMTFVEQQENGSFEAWDDLCNVPDAWTVEAGDAACSPIASHGDLAALLRAKPNELGEHSSTLAQTVPQGNDATDLPIVPGQSYELQFDAIGDFDDKGTGRATLTWVGAFGNVLRVDTIAIAEGGYLHYEERFQAPIDPLLPDAATSVVLRLSVEGGSSDAKVNLWVDNVRFGFSVPGPPPTPEPPPLPGIPAAPPVPPVPTPPTLPALPVPPLPL